ncbi:hypothetical protein [uncultured Psychroserpens sp.]|uniref:hypothetical protein n=1 Tax=uncultured Psychroserpens sp. TaxID=255436 RepID=UPI0026103FA4|nr:hypothetical protein [uncultured Psychroserpens sp.]
MSTKRIIYFFSILLLVFSCSEDDNERNQQNGNSNPILTHDATSFVQNLGNDVSRDFIGTVTDINKNPIADARIRIGNGYALTDINGTFIINNAVVKSRLAHIKAEKIGYINTSRSLVPSTGTNRVRIIMLTETITATTTSGVQETISLPNGASVDLKGQYVKATGTAYTGDVSVIMHFLDPTDESMPDQMPGMLYAANGQNEERMLQTFGMLAVELRSEFGQELNLARGSTAKITIPLDPSLLSNAPNTIPLWYFDEDNGYWVEDGEATLVANTYVGTVRHFSFWNCDLPAETVSFCATFTDVDNTPIDNLKVEITSSNFGTTVGFTNESGEVCGYAPSDETLDINASTNDPCITTSIYSSTIGPFTSDSSLDIQLTDFMSTDLIVETVTGNFVTCDNSPVTNGYVKIIYGTQELYHSVTDGSFEFNLLRCVETTSFELEAVDYENLNMFNSQIVSFTTPLTDVGIIQACAVLNSEYIQYTSASGNLNTLSVTSAGINGSGTLGISYMNPLTFGGPSFDLRINNYTTPGDYIGAMGVGDFTSNIPFATIVMLPYDQFEGTVTVISAGELLGEFITISFSGTMSSSFASDQIEAFPISGQIQAIRDY